MKNFYILALSLIGYVGFAQNTVNISFEESQGYTIGNLHGQNGWEIAEGEDGIIDGQLVSNEQSSHGTQSFKNSYLPQYEPQWFMIFGGTYSFSQPIESTNSTISFDFFITEDMGSDFDVTFYHQDQNNDFYPVAGLGILYYNNFFLYSNEDYQLHYLDENITWQANTWVNVRLEIATETIKSYINNQLVAEIPRFSFKSINGFTVLHNNYGGDAYFDNINITYQNLNNEQFSQNQTAIYPNPATDTIHVTGNNIEIESIEVYNLNGQKVLTSNQLASLNVAELSQGTYIVKVKQTNGNTFQRKIVKK